MPREMGTPSKLIDGKCATDIKHLGAADWLDNTLI